GYNPLLHIRIQQSKFGAFCTVTAFGLFFAHVGVSIYWYIQKLPSSVATYDRPSTFPPTQLPKIGFLFFFANNYQFADDSYFRVVYRATTIYDQDRFKPRKRVVIPTTNCSFSAYGTNRLMAGTENDMYTTIAQCPVEFPFIEGTFLLPQYTYLEATFERCLCPVNTTCTDCANTTAITERWANDSKIALVMEDSDGNTRSYPFFRPQKNMYYYTDMYLQRTTYDWLARIFWDGRRRVSLAYNLRPDLKSFPSGPDYDNSTFLARFYLRLDEVDIFTTIQEPTALEALSRVGAIISLITITFGTLGRWYNGKLYAKSQSGRQDFSGGAQNPNDDLNRRVKDLKNLRQNNVAPVAKSNFMA
ncbi:hypothetical protein BKA69DRAFT_1082105, partial [Paraphysoderma sedebokerense]